MARKNSLRLPYYDYRQGWFLITTITYRRLPLLGAIAGDALHLSPLGEFVAEAWAFTAAGKPGIAEHAFLLMPDHLHAVVGLDGSSGRLGGFVGSVKSRAARLAREAGVLGLGERLWHRGYHARWLLDDGAISRAVAYVKNNPRRS